MNTPDRPNYCAGRLACTFRDAMSAHDDASHGAPVAIGAIKLKPISTLAIAGQRYLRRLESAIGPRPKGGALVLIRFQTCVGCGETGDHLSKELPAWLVIGSPVDAHGNAVPWPCDGEPRPCFPRAEEPTP